MVTKPKFYYYEKILQGNFNLVLTTKALLIFNFFVLLKTRIILIVYYFMRQKTRLHDISAWHSTTPAMFVFIWSNYTLGRRLDNDYAIRSNRWANNGTIAL